MKLHREVTRRITVNRLVTTISLIYATVTFIGIYLIVSLNTVTSNYIALTEDIAAGQSIEPFIKAVSILLTACLVLMTLVAPIFMKIISSHFESQIVPLNEQIERYIKGEFSYRRHMRVNDEFLPFMHKVHKLGNKLKEDKDFEQAQ